MTKLTPEQISQFWDIIKFAIEESLPPLVYDSPDKMDRILAAALSDRIQVWASYVKQKDRPTKFEGIVLTQVLYDDPSNTHNLLIYCLYGYNEVDKLSWLIGLGVIAKYALSIGCSQIVGYTKVPYLINIANQLGADTEWTFISLDVNKTVQNLDKLEAPR